jgi:two-component system cell cycle sensor histidine kinase/response regulator CckA
MSDVRAAEGSGRTRPAAWKGQAAAIAAALFCAALALTLAWYFRDRAPHWMVAGGALLGGLGLFALLGLLGGFLRIGGKPRTGDMFEGLLDALGDPCVVSDGRGRPIYCNGPYLKLVADAGTGRLVGIDYLYTGYPDVAEKIYRVAQAAREGKDAFEEFRLAAGSGAPGAKEKSPVWFKVTVAPLPGRPGHTLWRLQDTSLDRARQEDAFSHLQNIINYLDHAPAGFFSAEPAGAIAYMNATLARWLGLDLDRTTGGALKLGDIAPESAVKLLAQVAPVAGGVRIESFDLDLKHKDGHGVPVRVLHRVDFDAGGRPLPSRSLVFAKGSAGTGLPEAAEAEARLARFFGKAPIGIAEADAGGIIRNANEAFVELSSEARRGAPLTAIVADSHREQVDRTLDAARNSHGEVHSVDIVLTGERARSVQLAVARLDSPAEGFAVYALDTTENKTLEVQLAQGQKMQAIGQLAGGVAHDFNNVLTAIIGFSDLLLAKHRPTDAAFADLMNIKNNANRAANLVRQLLAFSRRQTLRPEVLSLTDVLADLGNLLGRLLGEKVTFRVSHGRDLWPVKADLNQFEQVIMNLAVNARDAMPNGGQVTVRTSNVTADASREIEPGVMPPGEYVLCEVQDTGTGIPPEIRNKIWEPFFSTKDVGKGTGLGLATVYGIVKQTGGFIFCDSEVGKGTTFRIYLPRHVAGPEEVPAETPEAKKEERRADLTGKGTILLVEDEDAVRAFASRALASRGYTVVEASSGEQAIEIVESRKGAFDLVLSDVVMPEMDGPTLLKELRRRGVGTKIIFISGYAKDAFAKNLEGHSDFDFLPKPFSLKQLAAAVKSAMKT